ncbi:AMP-binding protein [Pseudogracilibacillus auburnensis]|uniref:Long-chain acyl-CoA synthetase/crotonobetaine/carnitine-CoA ligase n=1 Tax=Pseudogracilibacillus auburnensis TaxID=1494959 RepID=A0A2V3W7E1_9BACI|nr:AMP-binding protein [Pseudogracilibacillus auburnensis]PXW90237.1 long-chain acyl-CoA synthetase/crotonobetaine/carnitine-CoA ligase [Pseudogracilibacillus auburnensis]
MLLDAGWKQVHKIRKQMEELELPSSIGELLAEKVEKVGDKPLCIFFEDETELTYKELNIYSNRLANALLELGVRKGTHIAIMLPNVTAFPIAWMAIVKIGAVMVPLNVNYTAKEMEFVLRNSDAEILILDENGENTFREIRQNGQFMDMEVIVKGSKTDPIAYSFEELVNYGNNDFIAPTKVTLEDLCNIQYTSGTTGFPKGCMLTHHYWLLMAKSATYFTKQRIENFLIQFPFFYMEAQVELMMAIFQEGTVYVPKQASLTKFIDWIRTYNIHYCAFPEPIMKSIPETPLDRENSLRFISAYLYKGQAHIDLEKRFNVVGRDSFGMTEIGLGTHMPEDATHMVGSGSCGLPAPFRELRIVDDSGRDVEQGETGELWVTGPAMLWGYYKNRKANKTSFHGKWFKTGDLARQDENGYYYIVGRIKEMIKRSGENISALEVESVVEEIPGIVEAAAIPVPDDIRKEEVMCFIVLTEDKTAEDIPPEMIFAHCTTKLAAFKIPRYIAYIDRFPRTPSDKIAKQLLINNKADIRSGAFDRVENKWHP